MASVEKGYIHFIFEVSHEMDRWLAETLLKLFGSCFLSSKANRNINRLTKL